MKNIAALILALLLAACLPALAEENLLRNGDFSAVRDDMPEDWQTEMWYTDAGVSLLHADPDGYDGGCVRVTNVDANDARFTQTVDVEPDTLYKVSGMVRAVSAVKRPLPQPSSRYSLSYCPKLSRHRPRRVSGSRICTPAHRSIRGTRLGFFRILISTTSLQNQYYAHCISPAGKRQRLSGFFRFLFGLHKIDL